VGPADDDIFVLGARWQLQAQLAGGSWQNVCPPATQPDALATYSCNWNTTNSQYPDGTYTLRARITDSAYKHVFSSRYEAPTTAGYAAW
jgi:hypothetical protein